MSRAMRPIMVLFVALAAGLSTEEASAQPTYPDRPDPTIDVLLFDSEGAPVVNGTIELYDVAGSTGPARLVASGTTDSDGYVRLTLGGERELAINRLAGSAIETLAYTDSHYTLVGIDDALDAMDVHNFSYVFADHNRLAALHPELDVMDIDWLVQETEATNPFTVTLETNPVPSTTLRPPMLQPGAAVDSVPKPPVEQGSGTNRRDIALLVVVVCIGLVGATLVWRRLA